jgi:hypothetical protein
MGVAASSNRAEAGKLGAGCKSEWELWQARTALKRESLVLAASSNGGGGGSYDFDRSVSW